MKHNLPDRTGFTLIEVLIVLLILTSLVGLVGVNVLRHQGEAKIKTTKIQISQLASALKLYKVEQGNFPTSNQGLEALVRAPANRLAGSEYPSDGYLDGTQVPLDPWKQLYVYLSPGRNGEAFEIISYGGDREPGGAGDDADITSSELR